MILIMWSNSALWKTRESSRDVTLNNPNFQEYDGDIFSKNDIKIKIDSQVEQRLLPVVIPEETLATFIFIWKTLSNSGTDLKYRIWNVEFSIESNHSENDILIWMLTKSGWNQQGNASNTNCLVFTLKASCISNLC